MDRRSEGFVGGLDPELHTAAEDRLAIIKSLLRGESLTTFDAAIDDARKDPADGSEMALTIDMVTTALAEVSATIFPPRALEIQKQWMRKLMKNRLICLLG